MTVPGPDTAGTRGRADTYEYAALQVVPRPERGELMNAGVVLYCREQGFLRASVSVDPARVLALDPGADIDSISEMLESIADACAEPAALNAEKRNVLGERFRWLVAPRSTVVRAGPVHTGITRDPTQELERLLHQLVLPVAREGAGEDHPNL